MAVKPSCVICAWRAGCNKKFSIANPASCPDYTLDVSVKDVPGRKGVKVVIEGLPGTGKTTLVERLITKMKDCKIGGFVTREIREKGERKGFRIITVDKREGILAHEGIAGAHKVGKYTVNLEDLEGVGVTALRHALGNDDLVVIDEIGKMELLSSRFRDAVEMALGGECRLVATIAAEGPPFVDEVKHHPDVKLLKLTPGNRDELLEEVVRLLKEDGA